MPRRFAVGIAVATLVAVLALRGGTGTLGRQTASPEATPADTIEVALQTADGQPAGTATFAGAPDGGLLISVSVLPGVLTPGEHGIHVHETGGCDPGGETPFASAGGHFDPTGGTHGAPNDPNSHAGDLGNLTVAEDGSATIEITTNRFTIGAAPPTLADPDGSALVIHAQPDDLTSQPSGESGDRVVCGVIFPGMTPATPVASPEASPTA